MVVVKRQPCVLSSSPTEPSDERQRPTGRLAPPLSLVDRCSIPLRVRRFQLRTAFHQRCCILLLLGSIMMASLSINSDRLVERLNLLLGMKRSGQGLEVRAVLPLHIHPSSDETNPFMGRRCRQRFPGLFGGGFVCEECSGRKQCHILHPHDRTCRRPPVHLSSSSVVSQYKRDSSEAIAFAKVVAADQLEYNFHPMCSMEACWNMTRCAKRAENDGFILTVHVKGSTGSRGDHESSTATVARFKDAIFPSDSIEMADKADGACLVVVVVTGGAKLADTEDFPKNGQNVLVWDLSDLDSKDQHCGKAVIASRNGLQPWMRLEYDIIVPQKQVQEPVAGSSSASLISIVDSVYDLYPQWIAHQYWPTDVASVLRPSCPTTKQSQQFKSELFNSTFTLLPESSASLHQILSIGSIPVVLEWETLPFWPEVAWNLCAIHVDTKRIVDLPRLLSAVKPAEIAHRRSKCAHMNRIVFGDNDGMLRYDDQEVHSFTLALSIVHGRIRRALYLRERLESLMNPI